MDEMSQCNHKWKITPYIRWVNFFGEEDAEVVDLSQTLGDLAAQAPYDAIGFQFFDNYQAVVRVEDDDCVVGKTDNISGMTFIGGVVYDRAAIEAEGRDADGAYDNLLSTMLPEDRVIKFTKGLSLRFFPYTSEDCQLSIRN